MSGVGPALGWPVLLVLAACAGHTRAASAPRPGHALTGQVTYRERVALPNDAEVRVMLLDVSRMDVAATPIADTTLRPNGRQVPLPFVLRYDLGRIDPRRDYAVRATITSDGRLIFTTTTVIRVITRDHPTMVDLVLSRLGQASPDSAPSRPDPAPTGLWGTSWVLEDITGSGVIDYARATLEFPQQSRTAGRGSCNRFGGSVTVAGDRITFGPLASTMMACSEAVMNQERKYLEALRVADRYRFDGPYLLIYPRGMVKPLRFIRATP
jgi:putative lipoprotein